MKKFGRTGSTFVTVMIAAIVLALVGTTGAVAGGLITSKKIKDNTIKSRDVRNGNLTGIDIADGSIAMGDLAGAARGYTNIVTKTLVAANIANNAVSTRTVDCGAGRVAIGGGGYSAATGIVLLGTAYGLLEQSMPVTPSAGVFGSVPAADNVAPQGWRTTIRNDEGNQTSNIHYAICASK